MEMRRPAADKRRCGRHHATMHPEVSSDKHQLKAHEVVVLAVLSIAALVLSSMDQCTRGPSVTGLVLANASQIASLFC